MGIESRPEESLSFFPRLVRDKAPLAIKRSGKIPVMHIAGEDEYIHALRAKLSEEVGELLGAGTRKEFIDEAADVLEVLYALMDQAAVDIKTVESERQAKQTISGAFSKRVILDEVE